MKKKKICIVTGTRAEYGLFYPIMKQIQASDMLELQVVATTMHLSEEFGLTYREIEKDGFIIDAKVENLLAPDTKTSMAKSTGLATMLLSDTYQNLKPDVVLLLGDRFETHAAATTAMLMNIPIAHVHGGEVTEGAVDEKIRHSITKMASLHFTSTPEYRNRIIQMGEEKTSVFCTGAPGIDNILNMSLLRKIDLEHEISWQINKPTALVTIHSETLSPHNPQEQVEYLLNAISLTKINALFTYANADDGGRLINKAIEQFVLKNRKKYHVEKSLGQLKYLSAMKHVDLLLGNTSSGIIEAASFCKPVVNVGDRQKGRLQSGNVFNCEFNSIDKAISEAMLENSVKQCKDTVNIYGEGSAAKQIVVELEKHKFSSSKSFVDL